MHTINVEGMHCKHCEMLVELELSQKGAHHISAHADTGEVTFEGDVSPEAVEDAIAKAGFKVAN